MKKLISIMLGLCLLLISFVYASTTSYSDIPDSHWAYPAVNYMSQFNVVNGYPDGTFQPSKNITRAEFSKVIVRILEQNTTLPQDNTIFFMDVSRLHWAYDYIVKASVYLNSNHQNRFLPDNPLSREEIAMAMVKILDLEKATYDANILNQFSDKKSISESMQSYVAIAVEKEIMKGNANGTFTPASPVTRAELLQILYNSQTYNKLKLVRPIVDTKETVNTPKVEEEKPVIPVNPQVLKPITPVNNNISLAVELNEKSIYDGSSYTLASNDEVYVTINNPSTTKNFIYYMFTYGNLQTTSMKKIASSSAVITVPDEITASNVKLSVWGTSKKNDNTYVTPTEVFYFNYTGKPAEEFSDWDYETDNTGRIKSNRIEFYVVFNGSTLDNNELSENVKYGQKIIMRGRPVNNMQSVNYKWDNARNFTKTNEQTVTIDIPTTFAPGSEHKLTVTATNKDGKTTSAKTYYFIISPNAK